MAVKDEQDYDWMPALLHQIEMLANTCLSRQGLRRSTHSDRILRVEDERD